MKSFQVALTKCKRININLMNSDSNNNNNSSNGHRASNDSTDPNRLNVSKSSLLGPLKESPRRPGVRREENRDGGGSAQTLLDSPGGSRGSLANGTRRYCSFT